MQRRPTTIGLDLKSTPTAPRSSRPPRPQRRLLALLAIGTVTALGAIALRPSTPAPPKGATPPEKTTEQRHVAKASKAIEAAPISLVTRPIALPGQSSTTQAVQTDPAPRSSADTEARVETPPPAPLPQVATSPALVDTGAAVTTSASAAVAVAPVPARPEPVIAEEPASVERETPPPAPSELTLTVRSGDSLDRLFRRHGLSVVDLHSMLKLDEAAQALRMVRPGDEIYIHRIGAEVLQLTRRLDDFHLLQVDRADQGYRAQVSMDAPERRVTHAYGRITSSLFNAGRAAGVSDNLVMELAGIFAWDIDFVLDIREGDEFLVLYEELWRDGKKLRDGAILAAEFINTGERYQALRYVDPDDRADYFTPEGLSMRKAFLRAPVDFSRISSNFNPNRRHPILNTIRAHRGVDYAAPAGTPVKAAGDGKVSFRGVQSGYGNTVILQHGDNISTLYAHLSRFSARKRGARVRQGDVIGYVGKTGLASGNHLHYEYRVAGVHRNPRTVKLPQAQPIPKALQADFDAHAEHLLAQLQLVRNVRLAAVTGDVQSTD